MQREASVRVDVDVVVSLVVAGLVVAVILAASTCGSTLEKLGCGSVRCFRAPTSRYDPVGTSP
jgi:hypothetical protein